jgi:eukaryotic-like serine/threonine-protein kinase
MRNARRGCRRSLARVQPEGGRVPQSGEGHEAPGTIPPVLTFGAPTRGEILAERYQLDEHIGNDSLGRQLWRGVDVILRRPVAVVLRYPGGEAASEMLSAAVAASRIVHPHLAGVYDAIDEGERAYVVREWVNGAALRELLDHGPLDVERCVVIAQAAAAAVTALHETGMAHGNVHPGTVLVADDGRVVITDARADEAATPDADIRALGAILYCSLTAHWPHAEAGPTALPDALRDNAGRPVAPRQVRHGVPSQLDELVTYLLSDDLVPPSAEQLAIELSRFTADPRLEYPTDRAMEFEAFEAAAETNEAPRPAGRKIAIGVVGLLVIAAAGMIAATRVLGPAQGAGKSPTNSTTAPATGQTGKPVPLKLGANQVRIVDGPGGNRSEVRDADKTIDGNINTGWKTEHYRRSPAFGDKKPGMGILLDLGAPKQVSSVEVQLSRQGATLELRSGNEDPGADAAGDAKIIETYQRVGDPRTECPIRVVLPAPDQPVRYLLIFITKLPADGEEFQVGIQEITVLVE